MFVALLSHPVFGWFLTGHTVMSMSAVGAAVGLLDRMGLLTRMRTGSVRMKLHLSGLWLANVCQDIDEGNILGKCGIEVPGGQVAHFMRDSGQDPAIAYDKSVKRIWDECYRAWTHFKKGFPPKPPEQHHGGLLGVFEKVYEYSPVGLAVSAGKEVVEEVSIQAGVLHLARALHTYQDAFSPAHTLREGAGPGVIKTIYDWGPENKGKRPGWDGHFDLDLMDHSDLTKHWGEECRKASAELVYAVLSTLYEDQGVYVGRMRNVLYTNLKRAF
jgi:hypothetical protein